MAANKPQHSLGDYVVTALSPALIMTLIGSLVFFLLAVLYKGEYAGRMEWTLFFFVFGAVLIARIGMLTEIAGRATLYLLILGFATWLALQAFVEYPPENPLTPLRWVINIGLIFLVWWCAKRLTWDCTYIDDNVDASGKGVLESAGLDAASEETEAEAELPEEGAKAKKPATGVGGWLERYRRYQEKRKRRPHTPGVWVVYFSLAALPLFGLGHTLIPTEAGDRRRYVFGLMVVYVGSGLALLVTTSFLGLRRYLRQRQLQMPRAITGIWLAVGAGLIAAFLTLGMLLPRPEPQAEVARVGSAESKERDASRYAMESKDAGKGDENSSGGSRKPGEKTAGKSGNQRGEGQASDKSGNDKASSSGDKQDGKGKGQGKSGDSSSSSSGKSNDSRDSDQKGPNAKTGGRSDEARGKEGQESKSGDGSRSSSDNPVTKALSSLGNISPVVQKVVMVVVIVVMAVFLFIALLRFLANFTNWAASLLAALQGLWEALFGRRQRESKSGAPEPTETPEPAGPPSFTSFANPFLNGRAQRMSPAALVRYSFEALESWAYEHGMGRQQEETALEFADRLGVDVPKLEAEVRRLALLYARIAYAGGSPPASSVSVAQQFWQRLSATSYRSQTAEAAGV